MMKMDGQVVVTAACALLICVVLRRRRRRRRNRHIQMRESILNRKTQGAFHQLLQELHVCDVSSYRNFVHIDIATFEELLCVVAQRIAYQDTVMRLAISSAERHAVTLHFLAKGTFTPASYVPIVNHYYVPTK